MITHGTCFSIVNAETGHKEVGGGWAATTGHQPTARIRRSPWDITRSEARLEGSGSVSNAPASKSVLRRSSESRDTLTSDLVNSELHGGLKDLIQHSIKLDFNICTYFCNALNGYLFIFDSTLSSWYSMF